jgi:hypothetical protein
MGKSWGAGGPSSRPERSPRRAIIDSTLANCYHPFGLEQLNAFKYDPQEVIDHQGQYSQACRCKVKKSFPRRAVRFTFNGNIHPFLCQENPISRLLKLRIIGGIMFKRAAIFLTVVASLTLANVSHSYQLGFLNNHGQPRLQSPENGKVKHVDGGGCHVRARF